MPTKISKVKKELKKLNISFEYDYQYRTFNNCRINKKKMEDVRLIESRLCAARIVNERLTAQWLKICGRLPAPVDPDRYAKTYAYGSAKDGTIWCLKKYHDIGMSIDHVSAKEELYLLMDDGDILLHVNDEFNDSAEDKNAKEMLHNRLSGDQPRLPVKDDIIQAWKGNECRFAHLYRVKQMYELLYHNYIKEKYTVWKSKPYSHTVFVVRDASGDETKTKQTDCVHMWHTVNGHKYLWRIKDNELIREICPEDPVIDVTD